MSVRQNLISACLLILSASLTTPVYARSVTDHLNRTVEVPDHIERVAVADIFPYASAACVYLGSCRKIVAMHPSSMNAARSGLLHELYPEVADINTSVMQGAEVNLEALMGLGPDVVFVNAGNKRLIERLEAAGLPALAVSTGKWDYDVLKTYENWISLLDKTFPGEGNAATALKYAQRIEKLVSERTSDLAPEKRRKVLFLVQYDSKRIVTSGSRFFGQFWCDAAAAINAAESISAENANAVINIEQVYVWNPDVVFLTNFTQAQPADLWENRLHDWSSVKAVQNKAVYKMPLGLYRSYTPSADSPLTLLWMAKTLYPDRFSDIDMTQETLTYYKELFGVDLDENAARSLFAVR